MGKYKCYLENDIYNTVQNYTEDILFYLNEYYIDRGTVAHLFLKEFENLVNNLLTEIDEDDII